MAKNNSITAAPTSRLQQTMDWLKQEVTDEKRLRKNLAASVHVGVFLSAIVGMRLWGDLLAL
jgi:hypothetical protein